MSNGAIAKYEECGNELFDLYKRFRYGEIVASSLMNGAGRIEKAVRRSVLGLVAISFLTGSTSYLNPPFLSPVWAVVTALATILAVYAYIVGSSSKQFIWFSLARKFQTAATEMEFFSHYVKLGKITEDELRRTWQMFLDKLNDLLSEGGVEHREREEKNRYRLRLELDMILRREGKGGPPSSGSNKRV
jgi:hypothetical protein